VSCHRPGHFGPDPLAPRNDATARARDRICFSPFPLRGKGRIAAEGSNRCEGLSAILSPPGKPLHPTLSPHAGRGSERGDVPVAVELGGQALPTLSR